MLAFGGQTALNCGVALYKKGIFRKHQIRVLGTQVDVIQTTEDRDLFVKALNHINVNTPESSAVTTIAKGLVAAKKRQCALKYL